MCSSIISTCFPAPPEMTQCSATRLTNSPQPRPTPNGYGRRSGLGL